MGEAPKDPDIEQLNAALRKQYFRSHEWEMLWQEGFVDESGILHTHHLLDVDYWNERGVPYARSIGLDVSYEIPLTIRFPDGGERANEIAKWKEVAPSQGGPLREMVLRLLCEDKMDAEIEEELRYYMLAYDGTRLAEEQLLGRIAANRKELFKYFGVKDRRELIAEIARRGLILPQPSEPTSDD